jgi:hypothetical protein
MVYTLNEETVLRMATPENLLDSPRIPVLMLAIGYMTSISIITIVIKP